MYTFLLQDWTTIQAGSSASITQTEPFWLDTSGYLDLVTFMEVRQVSGGAANVYMAYQTAPTKDENLFLAMNDITSSSAIAMAVGLQVAVLLRDLALCPLSHWLRWQISAGGAASYDATFRIWVAASQPGGIADLALQDPSAVNMQFEGTAWTEGPTTTPTNGSPNPPINKLLTRSLQTAPTSGGSPISARAPLPFDFSKVGARRTKIRMPQPVGDSAPALNSGPDNSRLPTPYVAPGVKVIR